jgi:hypothetical protein
MDIKKRIGKNEEFFGVAEKYGDKSGKFTLNPETEKHFDFTAELKKLDYDDVSGVIYTGEGYYIFKCIGKNSQDSNFNYVFIEAKTLNEYLDKTIGVYKFLSLAD